MLKKLPKVNNLPMAENSPNQVTAYETKNSVHNDKKTPAVLG
jgi:hypothetical protein